MSKNKGNNWIFIIVGIFWLYYGTSKIMEEKVALGVLFIICGLVLVVYYISIMVNKNKKEKTIGYYEKNADAFIDNTFDADMSETRNKFLALLPSGGTILDWGCGSGRDTKAFLNAGYRVEATDASSRLCEMATEKTGVDVRCETFEELGREDEYDGIWACASLLHEESAMLPEAFIRANKALRDGGILYMSFKYGTFEGMRGDRYFVDMTEENVSKLLNHIKYFTILESWVTSDVRPGRETEKWLNVLVKKQVNQ